MRRASRRTAGTHAPLRALALSLTALMLVLATAAPAFAWSNGPQHGDGFGTHDWILYQASRMAAQQGFGWVEFSSAQLVTDDPDTSIHDYYYHVYDVWGDRYGDSPSRVAGLYAQAVEQLKTGDRVSASRTVGLLSHYLADSANPLHTDQTPAEKNMHSRYETAVDRQLRSPDALADMIAPHTVVPARDARAATVAVATSAHASYAALVAEYNQAGNDSAVQEITAQSMNRAVDALADQIAGIAVAAGERPTPAQASVATPTTGPATASSAAAGRAPADSTTTVPAEAATAPPPPAPVPAPPRSNPLASVLWFAAGGVLGVALFGVGVVVLGRASQKHRR